MQTFPPIWIINLDGSDARLAQAARQLDAAGLPFERLPAFDGRGLSVGEFPDYDPERALAYMGRPLRGGEIGCYLSHLEAARRIATGAAPIGIVLEDDMALSPAAGEVLRELVSWAAPRASEWDLINLGPNKHKIYTPLASIGGGARSVTRAHYFPMTTTGLVWSRAGAQAFVAAHETIFAPVDNFFRFWLTRTDRGLAVWPPLVRTTGAESQIDAAPRARSREGRHPLYGLIKQRRLMADKLLALRHKYLPSRVR